MQQSNDTGVPKDAEANETTARGTSRKRVALSPHADEIRRWVGEGHSDDWIASALGTSRSSVQSFRSRRGIKRRGGPAETVDGEQAQGDGAPAAGEIAVTEDPGDTAARDGYEGVLDQGEEEGYGLWLDPAVADDPLFREGFSGVRDVRVVIERGRIVLEPAPATQHASGDVDEATVDNEAARQLELITGGTSRPSGKASGGADETEQGRIKWFSAEKGYGFIFRPDGSEIFFHTSELAGVSTEELLEGRPVSYETGRNSRGSIAKSVKLSG